MDLAPSPGAINGRCSDITDLAGKDEIMSPSFSNSRRRVRGKCRFVSKHQDAIADTFALDEQAVVPGSPSRRGSNLTLGWLSGAEQKAACIG
jgi:hypothetical protein